MTSKWGGGTWGYLKGREGRLGNMENFQKKTPPRTRDERKQETWDGGTTLKYRYKGATPTYTSERRGIGKAT